MLGKLPSVAFSSVHDNLLKTALHRLEITACVRPEDQSAAPGASVCNQDVLVYCTCHVCADYTQISYWPRTYMLVWSVNSEKST
jgi:hypothetical protein